MNWANMLLLKLISVTQLCYQSRNCQSALRFSVSSSMMMSYLLNIIRNRILLLNGMKAYEKCNFTLTLKDKVTNESLRTERIVL